MLITFEYFNEILLMTKKNFANRTTTAARSFVPEGGRLICICRLLHMSVVVVGCG